MLHHQHALLWQIRGRRSSGYGQHTWPRENRQEMHGHLAGSLNSWTHRSAMWQEERTTMWCVCACDNKISRKSSCSSVAWQLPASLSAVRLAIACCFENERKFCLLKIQLRPRRAPRAFAAFRLATIYLPQCLLLKWVVVKYSGVPLPVCV